MYVQSKWKNWLETLKLLANGTRVKLRNIISAIYAHAIRFDFDHNPITKVQQSAKRSKTPEVLTVEELKTLVEVLEGIYRVMVYVGG